MGSFRNTMAAMLMTLTFVAFQSDASAQAPRGESRTATRSSRQAGSSSSVNRSSSQTRQSATRPSGNVSRPSGQSRPTATRPSTSDRKPSNTVSRPSSQTRPSGNNNRPSGNVNRPSGQTRPSGNVNRPSGNVNRPSGNVNRPSGNVNRPSDNVNRPSGKPDFKPGNNHNRPVNVTRPGRPAGKPAVRPDHRPDRPVQIRPDHRHDRPRVHPRDRDFMVWSKPSYFWTGHNHYYGHRVRVLPSNVLRRMYRGVTYYCYNDIWYRPYGGYYVVCRPPYGISLAANLIADMTWTAVRLSYYNTVANTYRQVNDNNRYIAEQNEIIAQNNALIASQNAMIAQNQQVAQAAYTLANELGLVQSFASADSEYFYQDGVFYAKDAKGEYQVIVPPAGALVETLPEDYDMVTLNGDEYYKVDDTVYKVTITDGKPYFEVLGQMIA